MRWISRVRPIMRRLLVAFDFDHTIADDNTDTVVRDMLPDDRIPPSVRQVQRTEGWTSYMGKVFELLHSNGVRREDIRSAVASIPPTPGMDTLLRFLHESDCETIIISDSNTEFIRDWLDKFSLGHTVGRVFTNPASYDPEGRLTIDMYHVQDWCKLSTKNLCKGYVLDRYIKERADHGTDFQHVAYVGDGKNDLCPCLRLTSKDLAFPRLGYDLMTKIRSQPLKASIYPWKRGEDIMGVLSKLL